MGMLGNFHPYKRVFAYQRRFNTKEVHMDNLTLLNLDLDLDLTLLDDDEAFTDDLVAFAEKLEQQWHELLAEQSKLPPL